MIFVQTREKGANTLSDFERTKQVIGGRSILITSWYDDTEHNWRASAPLYAFANLFGPSNPVTCQSRQAAIEGVCTLLANYFEQQNHPG
jgi:hypothetical protein